MSRTAQISRTTGETDIRVSLELDGSGAGTRTTGVGFYDHMLDAFARHGGFDLDVDAKGDLETGAHHTVEDVGIAIGQAIDEALGDRSGITRFGHAVVPMDDARASAAIDVSGRPYVAFEGEIPARTIGGFETDLVEEFLRAVANNAKLTVHVTVERGRDPHHMVEACFKAFARALRVALSIDPDVTGIPSTKGLL
ncbi:MAG: imidazoleglycerol-phosphate dehydratase [Thermoleophilaceae bacterium]|jgi:imidazoleglycerol-phosphate dehydratase|nr:imidazoleglycerol-phosphate dehydratase [Thermoleophilaceae bacterium]